MHYYQFNIGDYASHTQHLDPLEDIAYRRMLDWYYLHESPLPDDVEKIGRLIRMRTHCECIANVLQEFFALHSDGYHSDRADKEIAAFREKSNKAKAAANARWDNKNNKLDGDADAMRTHSECNANHKPLTNNHKPNKERAAKRGSRLTDETLPDEWESFCMSERPELHPHSVFSEFRDYWIAQPGQKGVKLDWFATWRNWVRRQRGKNGSNREDSKSRAQRVSDKLDEIARRDIEKNGFAGTLD